MGYQGSCKLRQEAKFTFCWDLFEITFWWRKSCFKFCFTYIIESVIFMKIQTKFKELLSPNLDFVSRKGKTFGLEKEDWRKRRESKSSSWWTVGLEGTLRKPNNKSKKLPKSLSGWKGIWLYFCKIIVSFYFVQCPSQDKLDQIQ